MNTTKQNPGNQIADQELENRILKQAARISDQWIMLETPDDRVFIITGAFAEITGYQHSEIISAGEFKAMIEKHDLSMYEKQLNELRSRQTGYHLQLRIITRQGNIRWIDHKAEKYFDESGRFAGWLSTNTAIKLNMHPVLGKIFQNMHEAVMVGEIIINAQGKPVDWIFLMVNRAYEKYTGLLNQDVIGRKATDVFPYIEKQWIERYGEVALTGVTAKFQDFNLNTDSYFNVSCYQIKKYHFAVIFTDITQQKKTEIQLRENRYLYQSIVNSQKELICRFKPDTTLVFVNHAYCKAFNTTEDELLGRKFIQFVPQDAHQHVFDNISELLADGGYKKNIHKVNLPGNEIAWYEWTNYIENTGSSEIEILSTGYDIT
ncbi:MAG: PAS domain S-box protein, partial [Bacteroidales bacterium]|nr:PAS domain S-box protein [Bacteroidales bacterium]